MLNARAREFLERISRYVVVVGSVARGSLHPRDLDLLLDERFEETVRRILREREIPFDSVFPGNWTIPSEWGGVQIELLPIHRGPDFRTTRRRATVQDIDGVALFVARSDDAG
jgi:predicted nucleotidyltransferase